MNSNLFDAISHDMTDIAKALEEQGLQVLAWFGLGQDEVIEQEGIKVEEISKKVLEGIDKEVQDPSEEIGSKVFRNSNDDGGNNT